jgi:hypothetical protein
LRDLLQSKENRSIDSYHTTHTMLILKEEKENMEQNWKWEEPVETLIANKEYLWIKNSRIVSASFNFSDFFFCVVKACLFKTFLSISFLRIIKIIYKLKWNVQKIISSPAKLTTRLSLFVMTIFSFTSYVNSTCFYNIAKRFKNKLFVWLTI